MQKPNLDTVPEEFVNFSRERELMPIAPENQLGVLTNPEFEAIYHGCETEDVPERFLSVVKSLGKFLVDGEDGILFPYHTAVRTAWHHITAEVDITDSTQFKVVQSAYFLSQGCPQVLPMILETANILDADQEL